MIVERHYDDEALIAIIGSEGEGTARDPHLVVCTSCADTFASYRAIADVLGSDAVWDLRDLNSGSQPETAKTLREFATRLNSEAETAESLIDDLLRQPRSSWLTTVQKDARFANAGLVRLLVERSEVTLDQAPPDAASMVRAAVDIAERLDSQQLRGAAWRQYGYALFYTGDFANALDAVEVAQRAFEQCPVADYDLARLGIVRALIYSSQERFVDAHAVAKRSAQIFEAYGDRSRLASAMSASAFILLGQMRYNDALPILLDIESNYRDQVDGYTLAITAANIAYCYSQTSRIAEALNFYQIAADGHSQLGNSTEAARIEGSVAALLAGQGQYEEAKRRLRRTQRQFEAFGMRADAVSVGLTLAEVLLVENAYEEVEALSRRAIEQFRESGVAHSARALVALTYLQEAAQKKRVTAETVRTVKEYLERLPRQPKLQFAPPPLPPE